MTPRFDIIVQKYGGSSVASAEKIKSVAHFIGQKLSPDLKICVVVSAMGHTTNQLIALAHEVNPDPPKRELDMLTSCGERSSMALLAMALSSMGIKAKSLTGSQSGIITDDTHSGAEIITIKPDRVFEAFLTHQVVIIAGFQGVSLKREITTLRRGGSDTTAVAMAAALKAQVCEIYTDVPGVMDIDPKIVENSQVLPALSFGHMEALSLYGAKVLAHDAIRLAKEFGVLLRIAQMGEQAAGTLVGPVDLAIDDKKPIIAITHLCAIMRIAVKVERMGPLEQSSYFLCGSMQDDDFIGYASNDIAQELPLSDKAFKAGLALITLHLANNHVGIKVFLRMRALLSNNAIPLKDVLMGGDKIFMVLDDDRLSEALNLINHDLSATEG